MSSARARRKLSCAEANASARSAASPRAVQSSARACRTTGPCAGSAARAARARRPADSPPAARASRGPPRTRVSCGRQLEYCADCQTAPVHAAARQEREQHEWQALRGYSDAGKQRGNRPILLERPLRRGAPRFEDRRSQSGASRPRRPATSCRQGRRTRRWPQSIADRNRQSRRCASIGRRSRRSHRARAAAKNSRVKSAETPAIHGLDGSETITSYWRADSRRCDRPSPTSRRTAGLRNTS